MSTMVSQITSFTIVYRLFRRRSKKTSKELRHWPLWWEFTGDRWIPRTKGQLQGNCFHLMTSSCPIIEMPWTITIDHAGQIRWNYFPYYCTVCVVKPLSLSLSLSLSRTHTQHTHTWCLPFLMLKPKAKWNGDFGLFCMSKVSKLIFDKWIDISGIYGITEK